MQIASARLFIVNDYRLNGVVLPLIQLKVFFSELASHRVLHLLVELTKLAVYLLLK